MNLIRDWCEKLSEKGSARLAAILEHLEQSKSWQKPEFKRLSGKAYKDLGEIRFKADNVQHRIIGMNGPAEGTYTLLIGCTHKDNIYEPPNALVTAVQRKKNLEDKTGSTCDH
ncbi:MAG: hypothetical protein WCC11_04865 [Gammaproteobacteria bacterium]